MPFSESNVDPFDALRVKIETEMQIEEVQREAGCLAMQVAAEGVTELTAVKCSIVGCKVELTDEERILTNVSTCVNKRLSGDT